MSITATFLSFLKSDCALDNKNRMLGKRVSTGNLQGAVSGPDSGEGVRNQDTFDGENVVRRKRLYGVQVLIYFLVETVLIFYEVASKSNKKYYADFLQFQIKQFVLFKIPLFSTPQQSQSPNYLLFYLSSFCASRRRFTGGGASWWWWWGVYVKCVRLSVGASWRVTRRRDAWATDCFQHWRRVRVYWLISCACALESWSPVLLVSLMVLCCCCVVIGEDRMMVCLWCVRK